MRLFCYICISVLFLSSMMGSAQADKKGQEILLKTDTTVDRAKDQDMVFDMVVHEPGQEPRVLTMKVFVKGEKRLVHFLAPGDVKDMKMLTLSRDKMYVYLPAYRKIRRIANHAKDQTISGADFTYEDMSTSTYADVYEGKFISEDKEHQKVLGILKSGAVAPFPRIELTIRKDNQYPLQIRFYNSKGVHIKTETRTDYICKGNVCNAKTMKMVDHSRNNHWTTIELKDWRVNIGIDDKIFSLRNLQRGH